MHFQFIKWPRKKHFDCFFCLKVHTISIDYYIEELVGIHPINRERYLLIEFHHLYYKLRKYSDKFFSYLRMSVQTFDYLLEKVNYRLDKNVTNFVKNRFISPTERLIIIIKYVISYENCNSIVQKNKLTYLVFGFI